MTLLILFQLTEIIGIKDFSLYALKLFHVLPKRLTVCLGAQYLIILA